MPNIRIMNWNIEQLSWNKIRIPGQANAIARVIHCNNADIAVLLELKKIHHQDICDAIVQALNALTTANLYTYVVSNSTAGEYYGFIIRNLGVIRPLEFSRNPHAPAPNITGFWGDENNPLDDLQQYLWRTWPAAFPAPAPAQLPLRGRIGLVDLFAAPDDDSGAKRSKIEFRGQKRSGYTLGRGFRIPAMALFAVQGTAACYLIPVVCCHYAAVRRGKNALAQTQISQLPMLHIAQLFMDQNGEAGYLDTDLPGPPPANAAPTTGELVQNLILMGDFNVDFLENSATGTTLQKQNRAALQPVTPTAAYGQSQTPAAAAGVVPVSGAPLTPFTTFPEPATADEIPGQALRAACTGDGTHLRRFEAKSPWTQTVQLVGAAFDNFFYGGAQVTNTTPNTGDSAEIFDLPGHVVQPGGITADNEIEVAGAQHYYANKINKKTQKPTRHADQAPNLSVAVQSGIDLTVDDMWIGARLVSDHLPVILEFNCP